MSGAGASSCSSSGTPTTAVMELNDNKAGMLGLDKARIGQIIEAASRGSKFYARQAAKREADDRRAAEDRRRVDALSAEALTRGERAGDAEIRRALASADFGRTHVHVDMDAFYAAVEMLDNPALRRVPMAVGGNDMLSTSNYAARRFGVRAGMPGFIGRKLCPELIIVPCRFRRYKEVSRQVQTVLAEYDPHFSAASLDEAYLDITDHVATRQPSQQQQPPPAELVCECPVAKAPLAEAETAAVSSENLPTSGTDWRGRTCPDCHRLAVGGPRTFGATAAEAAAEMRYRIFSATGLTASAGLGPNPMLAKICSDFNKPNGQYSVAGAPERVLEFVRPLAVRKVPGIGRVAEQWLQGLGVATCRDLYERRGALHHLCGQATFRFYMRACVGIGGGFGCGDSGAEPTDSTAEHQKSISVERTFQATESFAQLSEKLAELSDSLGRQLIKAGGLRGRTVTLKLKLDTFEVLQRSRALPVDTDSPEAIRAAAAALLKREFPPSRPAPPRVRLLGVRLSMLSLPGEGSGGGGDGKKQASLDELLARRAEDSEASLQSEDASLDASTKSTEIKAQQLVDASETKTTQSAASLEKKSSGTKIQSGSSLETKSSGTKIQSGSSLETMTSGTKTQSGVVLETKTSETNTQSDPSLETKATDIVTESSKTKTTDAVANKDSSLAAILTCPICSAPQCGGLAGLNSHLDFCLSRGAIQTAVSDFSASPMVTGTRKRADDSTASTSAAGGKRPRVSGGVPGTIDSWLSRGGKSGSR